MEGVGKVEVERKDGGRHFGKEENGETSPRELKMRGSTELSSLSLSLPLSPV